jgi:hypothetical protein
VIKYEPGKEFNPGLHVYKREWAIVFDGYSPNLVTFKIFTGGVSTIIYFIMYLTSMN